MMFDPAGAWGSMGVEVAADAAEQVGEQQQIGVERRSSRSTAGVFGQGGDRALFDRVVLPGGGEPGGVEALQELR